MLVGELACINCSLVTVVLTEPMKYLFGRARPDEAATVGRVVPLRKDVSNPSFPSGDSAQVGVLCLYVLRLL